MKTAVKEYEEMNLSGEAMSGARDSFDSMLQKLLKNMSKSGSDEGSITMKVEVRIEPKEATDSEGNLKMISVPIFKHSVSTQVPVKTSINGSFDTGLSLEYDEKLQKFVLRRAQIDGQMDIFDAMNQPEDSDFTPVKKELPGPSNRIVDISKIPPIDKGDYDYEDPEEE